MKSTEITRKLRNDRRTYDDACGAAHALELLGERWALLVVRELFFGPKRFSDLKASLNGISANVLTQRLEGLEATGIVRRLRSSMNNMPEWFTASCWRVRRAAKPMI